jgi:hypothetical protein
MISSALDSIVEELNQFLKVKFQMSENRAVLSNLINLDGSTAIKESNKIVVSLASIQEERLGVQKSRTSISVGDKPPVYLNLYVLFSAQFDEKLYLESLKFISAVISFFQSRNVFTPSDTPSLDKGIDKVVMKIENMDIREQSSLFSTLGAKYLPSVYYKLRMLSIDEETLDYSTGAIKERGTKSSLE